ncbi:MAG: ABC transporter substrate-binding protein [Rhizobacter sp.]|nr:ABC transporter substrate-binding protein [Rhizobacter sp.]
MFARHMFAWAVAGLMLPGICLAQIKIGQTAGFTGAAAAGVKEITDGAKLYIDHVNAEGGINGQSIELVSMDDKFDPKLAAENAKKLIADPKIVALFLNRGTPHSQAIMPLLAEHRITLIAPSTGAMALHQPVHPWVFNVRATYQRETEHILRHLAMAGAERVALIQVNDSFGTDAAAGALKVFKEMGKQPATHQIFDRAKPDFAALVPKVIAAQPLSILFIGTGTAVVDGVKALRAAGSRATIATLSPNASAGFIKSMGENAQGMIISQVFPSARKMTVAMAAEAARIAQAQKLPELTPQMFEGYAAAKVLVVALRRAAKDKDLTRTGIKKALESFNHVDIGGLEVTYSPTDHTGLDYADLSIVAADGSFRR